jgi:hypothetical protein
MPILKTSRVLGRHHVQSTGPFYDKHHSLAIWKIAVNSTANVKNLTIFSMIYITITANVSPPPSTHFCWKACGLEIDVASIVFSASQRKADFPHRKESRSD